MPFTILLTRLSSINMSAPTITIGSTLLTAILASAKANRLLGIADVVLKAWPFTVIVPPPAAFRKMDPGAERSAGNINARALSDSLMVPVS